MPSIKMKSPGDPLRENNGLHVCQKSSKISKNSSFSHTRNVQHEAELNTCPPNKQDDSISKKATDQEIRCGETNCCDVVDTELIQVQKHLSPSSGIDIDCRTDHTANCSSSIETIFSPILESIEIEPNIFDYGGRENDAVLPSCGEYGSFYTSRMSCEYQTCNVSDLFIPDMIVTSSRLLDYECNEASSISEDPNVYVAIHQLKSCSQESDVSSCSEWDPSECLDPQMFIKNLLDISSPSILPKQSKETKSITLVLDLDETLVHSSLEHCDDADFTFTVISSLKEHTVYVKQRPYLRTFLERVSEMFHIVIFTASQSIYAKQLLDILDPDGKIIFGRAYRESCIFADGIYTKDLTVLGVDLSKIVIIDNSPQVFRLQANNGIPIKSWFDDPSDCALITLLPFLETLVDAEDVRPIIAKRFGNK